MKSLLTFLIFPILLTACSHQSALQSHKAYADHEVYQGYPCQPNCQAFKSGYDHARKQKFTQPTDCSSVSSDETLGCKSYVNEYQFENQPAIVFD